MKKITTKHSPGPWKWAIREFGSGSSELVDANGGIVCDDGSAFGEYTVLLRPESHDGKLIEASPDLLRLLHRMTDAMENSAFEMDEDVQESRALINRLVGVAK